MRANEGVELLGGSPVVRRVPVDDHYLVPLLHEDTGNVESDLSRTHDDDVQDLPPNGAGARCCLLESSPSYRHGGEVEAHDSSLGAELEEHALPGRAYDEVEAGGLRQA